MHYPTDINLLFDAARKAIQLIAAICSSIGISAFRQHAFNIRTLKKLYNKARKLKHSTSKDPEKIAQKEKEVQKAHQEYTDKVESFTTEVRTLIPFIKDLSFDFDSQLDEIETFIAHAERQIDQIRRRVLQKEVIPHNEKVFSLFQPHTEWISKGKAGVPQELGLRVSVLSDQFGFILHHRVMEKETDDKVAVPMVLDAQKKFPNLYACSFDKGYYTPDNKTVLMNYLDHLTMPKKGKLSEKDKEYEHSETFVKSRKKHAAVESSINALEVHGLDRCPDNGINGFKRYVGLSVLGRNFQILGHHIQQDKLKSIQRPARKAA